MVNSSIKIKLNMELKPKLVEELCTLTGSINADALGLYINMALKTIVTENLGIENDADDLIDIDSDVEVIEDCTETY